MVITKEEVKKWLDRHPDFVEEWLEDYVDDCPFYESCGEAYMESAGEDYYDGRRDAYD
jgi:hypothetical protein